MTSYRVGKKFRFGTTSHVEEHSAAGSQRVTERLSSNSKNVAASDLRHPGTRHQLET